MIKRIFSKERNAIRLAKKIRRWIEKENEKCGVEIRIGECTWPDYQYVVKKVKNIFLIRSANKYNRQKNINIDLLRDIDMRAFEQALSDKYHIDVYAKVWYGIVITIYPKCDGEIQEDVIEKLKSYGIKFLVSCRKAS